jgi:hypothetical protein
MSARERLTAWSLPVATTCTFALCVYRAATQGIVHDEALTFNWFPSPERTLGQFDANNHVLNTLLIKLAISASRA